MLEFFVFLFVTIAAASFVYFIYKVGSADDEDTTPKNFIHRLDP